MYIYIYTGRQYRIVGRYVRSSVHVPSGSLRTWKWFPIPERYLFLRAPEGSGSAPSPSITRHRLVTNRVWMIAQGEIQHLFCMELRSPTIWCFQRGA